MPRVTFVNKARKDIPESGIKRGDSYFWWKFRFGSKHVSKTKPKPSQLTQSEYLGSMYSLQEDLEANSGSDDFSSLVSALEDAIAGVEEQKDSCEDKRSNMPDHLQDCGTGELLQNRVDACESLIGELEDAKSTIEDFTDLPDELETLQKEVNKFQEEVESAQKALDEAEESDIDAKQEALDLAQSNLNDKEQERDEKEQEITSALETAKGAIESIGWDVE